VWPVVAMPNELDIVIELHLADRLAFGQASHVPKSIVMLTQSASDTVEIPKYEATLCILQDHVVGFV
jgi:hypothetical protein